MPQFVEDPAYLSKSRLKSDLVAHDVALPPARSKKQVYVELHKKHIDQKTSADFSSDEEDRAEDGAEEDPELPDPGILTDDGLQAELLKHGVKAGPIVASTRALYEKKLRQLLQSDRQDRLNGAEKGVLYSDSEEEEEKEQKDDADSDSEGKEQTMEQSDRAQQASRQVDLHIQNGDFYYPQCFLPSSRLRVRASRNREPDWSSRIALKSSEQSQRCRSQIPVGISKAMSVGQCSRLASGVPSASQSVKANDCSTFSSQTFSITQMVEEMESRGSPSINTDAERELNEANMKERWSDRLDMPVVENQNLKNQTLYYTPKASPHKLRMKELVKDTVRDLFPNTKTTPTGIYAARRRPIKGAAGRPVQYVYPDSPASPLTLERRETERRLVPVHIQILVFIVVACLLYLIYVCVEDNSLSPFVNLLESLSQGTEGEDRLLFQDKTQETPALSTQQ